MAREQTLMAYLGWSVAWNESDISTMSPEMPLLTTTMHIPTWTPGQLIPDGEYHRWPDYTDAGFPSKPVILFVYIGIPLTYYGVTYWFLYFLLYVKSQEEGAATASLTGATKT